MTKLVLRMSKGFYNQNTKYFIQPGSNLKAFALESNILIMLTVIMYKGHLGDL